MKTPLLLLIAFSIFANDLLLSPALTDNALSVTVNPAGLGTYRKPNFGFTSTLKNDSMAIAGLSLGGFGLGATTEADGMGYYLAQGFRIRSGLFAGMRTGYVDTRNLDYYNYDIGLMVRPGSFLSLGASTKNLVNSGTADPSVTLGGAIRFFDFVTVGADADYIRDFSTPRLTLDMALGGLNVAAKTDLDGKEWWAGVTLAFSNAEFGLLYPVKGSGGPVASVWSGLDRKQALIETGKQTALITIQGVISDDAPDFSLFGSGSGTTLASILNQLRNAANDKDVRNVILNIGGVGAGLGVIEEIRNAVRDLRLANKRTTAYLSSVDFGEYYLATGADEIVVEPMAPWVMAGFSAEIAFLKGTLDKIGIKAEFERVGDYKTAIEPMTRDSMSGPFRENETLLLSSIYDHLVDGIVTARGLERDTFIAIIDRGTIPLKTAVDKNLINKTGYLSELLARHGGPREKSVDLSKRTYYAEGWKKRKRLALVNCEGTIIDGPSFTDFFSGERFVGSETMAGILRKIRLDRSVKGVVLRINSPGGSGVASDVIWHEVKKLKEAGKPVIVSIGDMAASGGYYIACCADSIVCSEGSIVGSIGVFSGKFVLKGLYDKIGLTKQFINFGKNADAFSDYKEFTEEQRALLKESLAEFYQGFVDRVAEGRDMKYDSVDALGRGRVFTGIQAFNNGLVDAIGGISDAIDMAKEKSGFTDDEQPEIVVYPKKQGFLAGMMEEEEIKASRNFFKAIESLNNQKVLALMPYRIKWK